VANGSATSASAMRVECLVESLPHQRCLLARQANVAIDVLDSRLDQIDRHIGLLAAGALGVEDEVDEDLADLYGVETKRLVEQVKRNLDRFPEDFMFQLNKEEAAAKATNWLQGAGG
jgi:hypothetical protein